MSIPNACLPQELHQDNIASTISYDYRILGCTLPKYADLLVSTQPSSRHLEPHICNNHHVNYVRSAIGRSTDTGRPIGSLADRKLRHLAMCKWRSACRSKGSDEGSHANRYILTSFAALSRLSPLLPLSISITSSTSIRNFARALRKFSWDASRLSHPHSTTPQNACHNSAHIYIGEPSRL